MYTYTFWQSVLKYCLFIFTSEYATFIGSCLFFSDEQVERSLWDIPMGNLLFTPIWCIGWLESEETSHIDNLTVENATPLGLESKTSHRTLLKGIHLCTDCNLSSSRQVELPTLTISTSQTACLNSTAIKPSCLLGTKITWTPWRPK